MRTNKQLLGDFGENLIIKKFNCPKCKRLKSLKKLPPNFKCADIICDFCGYLAQVKTKTVSDIEKFPSQILGAAWPSKRKNGCGNIFPFICNIKERKKVFSILFIIRSTNRRNVYKKKTFIKKRKTCWMARILF